MKLKPEGDPILHISNLQVIMSNNVDKDIEQHLCLRSI